MKAPELDHNTKIQVEDGLIKLNEDGWVIWISPKLKEQDKGLLERWKYPNPLGRITIPDDAPAANYKCKKCRDMGWEEHIEKAMGCTYVRVKRCICLEKRMQEAAINALREVYPVFGSNSFKTYKPESESQREALECCREFVTQWPDHDGRGILLCGPVGTGKTCLLYLTMLGCIQKRRFGFQRVKTEKLLSRIRSTFNKGVGDFDTSTEYTITEEMSRVDVLLLDDLGVEKVSDFTDRVMFNILDERYEKKKLTFATSNFVPEAEDEEDDLKVKLGKRIYSRRHEMFTTIVVEGDDRRKRK